MSKLLRHAAILRVVRSRRVPNQDALREALEREGMQVTQATLSRDIRELALVKQADPDGGAFYTEPAEGRATELAPLVQVLLRSLEGVGALLVLHTVPGGAAALASALDEAGWSEIAGTVAGHDTVLVVARGEAERARVEQRLERTARQAL